MFWPGDLMTFVCPKCGVSLVGPVACPHDGAVGAPANDARAVAALSIRAAVVLTRRPERPPPVPECTASTGTFELKTNDGLTFSVDGAPDRKIRLAIPGGEYPHNLAEFPRGH